MKRLNLRLLIPFIFLVNIIKAQQLPVANFSFSPASPVCSGQSIQITDLSTGNPTSWSYTIAAAFGPGGTTVLTTQNPSHTFTVQGTYSITLVASNASGNSAAVTQTIQVLGSPNGNINPTTQNSCIGGNPVNLTAVTGGGGGASNTYSWSTGATGNSITVNPSVTTVYTCVITSTNGCSSVRTATVVIGTPTVNISANPTSICPGSSSTLNATSTGSAPYTYSWSNGASTSAISVSVSGVYDVTVTNAGGCSGTQSYSIGASSTLALTVTSTPSVACAGNTATLHATGATSYLWNFNSSSANPTVSAASTSTYSVVGTAGTCSGTATYTLQVSQIPTISIAGSSSSICAGNSVTLTASGASTYTWLPGNTNSNPVVVSPSVTTTYSARGVNPGCNARTGTIQITVNPSPNVSISSSSSLACVGDVVALVASGASTYTWSTGSNNSILILTAGASAVYTVTGVNSSNCSATAIYSLNTTDCTGLSDYKSTANSGLQVYPNPNAGDFLIYSETETVLNVYNALGQKVMTQKLNAGKNEINTAGSLAPGFYVLRTEIKGNLEQKSVLIQAH
ncbi:MAG TPA: PKD domain-containing protein [Bacteroidia bacterium]|nr:PKD domain-containing protein [Bacteroidia bacterium]